MQLRYIALVTGCDCLNLDKEFVYKFNFNQRFISNYLSKAIRRYHYETDGTYKMIGVEIDHNYVPNRRRPKQFMIINNALSIIVPVKQSDIDAYNHETSLINRYEFYLSVLERGYHLINDNYKEIPVDLLLSLHDEFRNNGYKNEWLFKRIRAKEYGLIIEFHCEFTTFDFRFILSAYNDCSKEMIAQDYIFRTGPDEVFYDYVFKKVQVEGDKLIVYGFIGTKSFIIDLPSLAKGQISVEYRKSEHLDYQKDECTELINRITW